MAKVIAGMTMSLDGLVADRNGSVEPLYPDLESLHGTDYMNDMISGTGAVIIGRKANALPLFESVDLARIQLEKIDVLQIGPRTSLRSRVEG